MHKTKSHKNPIKGRNAALRHTPLNPTSRLTTVKATHKFSTSTAPITSNDVPESIPFDPKAAIKKARKAKKEANAHKANSKKNQKQANPPQSQPQAPETPLPVGFENIPIKFTDLGITPELATLLHQRGVIAPSEIQRRAIPAFFNGVDVSITGPTGQGKTLAYALPLIQKLASDETMGFVSMPSAPRAIILVPTRELALQVEKTTKSLSHADGYRLRSKAITGDQSPSYMRQLLRGEQSNRSIALLNSTESKVRDQIRLAATISSRIINQLFKDNGWTYQEVNEKKINRKVQAQRDEALDSTNNELHSRSAEICQMLKAAQNAMSNANLTTTSDPTKTVQFTYSLPQKPHQQQEHQIDVTIEDTMKEAEPSTQQVEMTIEAIQNLQVELSQIETTLAMNTDSSNKPTVRNWSQIKRFIKRETTRFSYAIFSLSQDYDHSLKRFNEIGVEHAKKKRRSLRKQGINEDIIIGEVDAPAPKSSDDPPLKPSDEWENSLRTQLARKTNMSPVFHLDEEDLIPGLNIHAVSQIEPLGVRTLANKYVTALAADKLHDIARNNNYVQLPLPLVPSPNPYQTSDRNGISRGPLLQLKYQQYNERIEYRAQHHKPIHVILPSEKDVQFNLIGVQGQASADDFERALYNTFGAQPNDQESVLVAPRKPKVIKSAPIQKTTATDSVENNEIVKLNELGETTELISRPALLKNKKDDGQVPSFDFSDDENIDIDALSNQEDSSSLFPVTGHYLELDRRQNNTENQSEDHEENEESENDTQSPDDTEKPLSNSQLKKLQLAENKAGRLPRVPTNTPRHSSSEDHEVNRQFFIDVDYVTKITLQSLIALSPYIVRYQDLTPTHDGMVINHDRINSAIKDHTIITYHTVAAQVSDYIRNLPTHELANLSSNIHYDMEEDAFLHKEAKENDPVSYSNKLNGLYHDYTLQRNLDILICTPARLLQLMHWRAVVLNRINYVVFDEADMLFTSRTHLPQNVKSAQAQLTFDKNQNVSKFLAEKRQETSQKTPLLQTINQLEIRNGELYEALSPLLRRMKFEYEFSHGYLPQVKTTNSIFTNLYAPSASREVSGLRTGLLISQQKQNEMAIKRKFPQLYVKSPEFQHLLKQFEAESLVNDYGVMMVQSTKANKTTVGQLVQGDDENKELYKQVQMYMEDPKFKSLLPDSVSTIIDPDALNNDIELDENERIELKKLHRLSKHLQPLQFVYVSATLSSTATQFKHEIMKIVPLYEEQYSPRPLIELSTQDSLCVPTAVKQTFIHVGQRDKLQILSELLQSDELKKEKKIYGTQTLVFCNTIASARAVQHKLTELNISCSGVHSGVPPRQRAENWDNFFNNETAVMVCTDIASRGVHHPSIRYIVNFDFPLSPVDYLHRAGRAATLPGQLGSNSRHVRSLSVISKPTTIHTLDPMDEIDSDTSLDGQETSEDIPASDLEENDTSKPAPIILDPEGRPVQRRGEVISLVCKADQVLAYAINETSKKLAPITSLSADKSHYVVQNQSPDAEKIHDRSRPQTLDEERLLTTTSPGYKEAKDKFIRQLQGVQVTQGERNITKSSLVNSAKNKAAKDWLLHRGKYSNQARSVRKVDLTSDRRRADEKYIKQQTQYAESMGFNQPLLTKTAKMNAEYPERIMKKKIDLSLQGMREKSYKRRDSVDNTNYAHKVADFDIHAPPIQRRTPSFAQQEKNGNDSNNNNHNNSNRPKRQYDSNSSGFKASNREKEDFIPTGNSGDQNKSKNDNYNKNNYRSQRDNNSHNNDHKSQHQSEKKPYSSSPSEYKVEFGYGYKQGRGSKY